MTLATGNHFVARRSELSGGTYRRRLGFTLIELMVVIAILMSLAAVLAVTVGPSILSSGQEKATRALLRKVILWCDRYKELNGHYPPDGIDSPVSNEEGERIESVAALYYALTTPGKATRMVAGIPREVQYEPIAQFRESELTPEDPDRPGVREIVDPFTVPLHYDNTENGKFSAQGGEVHVEEFREDEHPPDPRTLPESEGGVLRPNEVQSKGFDLWSHGPSGHDLDEPPTPVASWNLRE